MADKNSFIELVREMREAQKAYFKSRSQEDLTKAKDCERRVDAVLKAIAPPRGVSP